MFSVGRLATPPNVVHRRSARIVLTDQSEIMKHNRAGKCDCKIIAKDRSWFSLQYGIADPAVALVFWLRILIDDCLPKPAAVGKDA